MIFVFESSHRELACEASVVVLTSERATPGTVEGVNPTLSLNLIVDFRDGKNLMGKALGFTHASILVRAFEQIIALQIPSSDCCQRDGDGCPPPAGA